MRTDYIKSILPDKAPDLTPTEREVLASICYRCNEFGTDERTNAAIGAETGRHPITVSRTIKSLTRKGYLTPAGRTSNRRIGITYKTAAITTYDITEIYDRPEDVKPHSIRTRRGLLTKLLAKSAQAESESRAKSVPDTLITNKNITSTKECDRPSLGEMIQYRYNYIMQQTRMQLAMTEAGY